MFVSFEKCLQNEQSEEKGGLEELALNMLPGLREAKAFSCVKVSFANTSFSFSFLLSLASLLGVFCTSDTRF